MFNTSKYFLTLTCVMKRNENHSPQKAGSLESWATSMRGTWRVFRLRPKSIAGYHSRLKISTFWRDRGATWWLSHWIPVSIQICHSWPCSQISYFLYHPSTMYVHPRLSDSYFRYPGHVLLLVFDDHLGSANSDFPPNRAIWSDTRRGQGSSGLETDTWRSTQCSMANLSDNDLFNKF